MQTFILSSRTTNVFELITRTRFMAAETIAQAVARFAELYPTEWLFECRQAQAVEIDAQLAAERAVSRPNEF